MDWFDLLIKVIVIGMCGGLAVWAIRNLILERTKKINPEDVTITLGSLQIYCKDKREEYEKMQSQALDHAVELLKENLTHGEKTFDKFGKTLETMTITIVKMGNTITKLDTKLENEIAHSEKERNAIKAQMNKKHL